MTELQGIGREERTSCNYNIISNSQSDKISSYLRADVKAFMNFFLNVGGYSGKNVNTFTGELSDSYVYNIYIYYNKN